MSIVCTNSSCDAVQALKGQRFLSTDAPRLPLLECTSPETCSCVYRKYADRRTGPRREMDSSGLRRSSPNPERRRRRGRRKTDE